MNFSNIIKNKTQWQIETGDALTILKKMPNSFIQTSITSPPYYKLRDYGHKEQIGQEETPKEYIENIVEIYKEVKRVLREDGTCAINIGDKYVVKKEYKDLYLKNKDLMGLPWELASELRKDGWYLRQMYPWVKCDALPENVNDRPNTSIEYVIFLSKSQKYYFDMEGAKECLGIKRNWRNGDGLLFLDVPKEKTKHSHCAPMPQELVKVFIKTLTSEQGCCNICRTPLKRFVHKDRIKGKVEFKGKSKTYYDSNSKNSTTSLNTSIANKDKYVKTKTLKWDFNCNCKDNLKGKQIILDPFSGSGTTGIVAMSLSHNYIGIELNPEYADYSKKRLKEHQQKINQDIFST